MPSQNVPQAEFLQLRHKFRGFVAGFGSGKTWVGCAALCKHVWEWPGINSGYFAPTYPQIRDIFFPTIEEVAFDWGLKVRTKESDKEVEVGTHKPIGHSIPWLQGPGRLHFNCRSTSAPRSKSWRELGIPVDEMTGKQRSSMDGAVPADMTYGQWLERQSDARKLEVLGPTRFQLYKEGRDLDSFYKPSGEWLTLEQLKVRDAKFRQPTGEFTVFDAGHPVSTPDVSTPARRAAVEIEKRIRGDSLETGAFIDKAAQ